MNIKDVRDFDISSLEKISAAINNCGVYFLYDEEEIVYIGKSVSIDTRINVHKKGKKFDHYSVLPLNEEELTNVERLFINKYLPKYNKDGLTKIIKSMVDDKDDMNVEYRYLNNL